ncbi:hypothetical protein J6590_035344 [Homalodisca vitripennis]|nr:hypothetical protein J6590_035344 [Homalodisca vitripennis]
MSDKSQLGLELISASATVELLAPTFILLGLNWEFLKQRPYRRASRCVRGPENTIKEGLPEGENYQRSRASSDLELLKAGKSQNQRPEKVRGLE